MYNLYHKMVFSINIDFMRSIITLVLILMTFQKLYSKNNYENNKILTRTTIHTLDNDVHLYNVIWKQSKKSYNLIQKAILNINFTLNLSLASIDKSSLIVRRISGGLL